MIIGGRRVCGKTTQLIKKAHEEHLYIIFADQNRLRVITETAEKMGLDIPHPITARELPLRSKYIKEVLIDDLEAVLYKVIGRPILMMSTSRGFKQL